MFRSRAVRLKAYVALVAAHQQSPPRRRMLGLLSGLIAVAFLVPSGPAAAATILIPPNNVFVGTAYAELSTAWWQYTLSIPKATSPFFDATGASRAAHQNPESPVFFLVGSLDSAPVQRNACNVPFGKALFFPLVNIVDINVTNQSAADLRTEIRGRYDTGASAFATIDGVTLIGPSNFTGFRTRSTSFSVTLPVGNLFTPGLPAGAYTNLSTST